MDQVCDGAGCSSFLEYGRGTCCQYCRKGQRTVSDQGKGIVTLQTT
jgi:hypothetical protein